MRILQLLVIALGLAMAVPAAKASERHVFDPAAFEAAKQSGKSILVHVAAVWCGVCKVQKPVVAELAEEPAFRDLVIFDVDYDTQKEALRSLQVQKQSTLITFKGYAETGRSIGVSDKDAIKDLVKKAL